MELWIVITVAAAFLQNIRSTLQKHLKGALSTTGATFVRFGFGVPFAIAYVVLLAWVAGYPIPAPNGAFALWVTVGALSQIAGQALLIHLFALRNFAVGTAYSRTEPAQAALFGLVFLSDTLGAGVIVAIAISLAGVMLISVARSPFSPAALVTSLFTPAAGVGLASGAAFGLAAVAYRAASLALGYPNFMMQAAVTLVVAIVFQSAIMVVWMMLRDPDQLARMRAVWKPAALTGFVGATASFGWFMAMTLQTAAAVKALAQIEMLFAFASTVFVFREHINRLEVIGCVLIVAGILVLLAFAG